MEGMISKEFCRIQDTGDSASSGEDGRVWCKVGTESICQTPRDDAWSMAGEELLNSHDKVAGMLALEKKGDLQFVIEEQQAMGLEGLAEEDKYLMEISLADLETTSGEYQAYWLILLSKQRVMPSQYAASGLKQHLDAVKTITDRDGCLLTILSIYPGLKGAVVGETTLSRGSDFNAVWFCSRRMKTQYVG
eukprot:scaffold6302_cov157-Skeletonema_menzelii.AAC.1